MQPADPTPTAPRGTCRLTLLRAVLTVAAAGAVVAAAGACGGNDTAAPPSTVASPPPDASGFPDDWRPSEPSWADCEPRVATGARCATLRVPLDWSDPSGPTIDLALARLPATGDRIGSLLSNPGGPGGSGIDFLGHQPFSTGLSERFDLVSWDPRGVGRSTAVTCGTTVPEFLALDPSPDDEAERAALVDAADAVAEECGRTDGDLLPHLSTDEVVRDLEAIRLALGNEQLNYVGFSYGTMIGLRYAELFGDRIRAMALDGIVDPAQGFEEFLLGQVAAFDDAFVHAARRCADAGASACGVADLTAAHDEVAARVEYEPLPGGPDGRTVGPAEVVVAAMLSMYLDEGWRALGSALGSAQAGDGTALWDLAASYWDFGSFGAYAAVVCTDTPPPVGHEAFDLFEATAAELSPRFGAGVANEMRPCASWPAPPAGDAAPVDAPDAPPILLVGSTGDPATPLANAEGVAPRLPEGRLVVVDRDGHTAYGTDPCATRAVDRYLVDLELPAPEMRCPG